MQTATPLSTVSPNRPERAEGKSPSPAKPTPTRQQMPHGTPNRMQRSPGCMSPGANSPGMAAYQQGECTCPTCQYYKACYMYTQEAHSPEMSMASYQMYQYGYYPFGAGGSPMSHHGGSQQMSHGSQPQHGNHHGGHMSQPRQMNFSPAPSHHQMQMQGHQMNNMGMGHQMQGYPGMMGAQGMEPSMENGMMGQMNHMQQSHMQEQSQGRQSQGNPVVEQFAQSIGSLAKLACSANGRSMLQGVMRLQHLDKIQTIFDELIADADNVMLDSHGCHVIRSLIEVIDEHQLAKLMEVMHSKLILNMCTLSQYTRKILQTLFERHRSLNLQSIVDIMSTNAQYLAATQQGCISLMRVFERCTAEQKHSLAQPLMKSFADLACDPFGNYVVQCALEHSEPLVATRYAMDCFNGEFLRLATNKFGSNVCEKLIRVGNQSLRRLILDELIFNPAALQEAANNGFGNFVIQALVETSNSPTELKKVCDRLRPTIAASPYGHKIDAKIRAKRFPGQQPSAPAQAGQKHALTPPMAAF